MKFLMAATVCALAALSGNAAAQELPATALKVLGGMSTRAAYKEVELPFWSKTIPENSHGQVTAEIKGVRRNGHQGPGTVSHDEAGRHRIWFSPAVLFL